MDDPRVTASLLRWWIDAGVDVFVDETPQSWLGRKVAVRAEAQAAPVEQALPATLTQLTNWLMTSEDLAFAGPSNRRIAPFGVPGSAVMIITDMPSLADLETGTLFSGAEGQLLDAMLKAVGQARDSVYCAPLCPGRPTTGQIDADHLEQLGKIARHHIRLAAPQRVWLLGQSTSRAVLGADVSAQPSKLHNINHDGVNMAMIASVHPRSLLQHPRRKAKVWGDMKILFGGMVS